MTQTQDPISANQTTNGLRWGNVQQFLLGAITLGVVILTFKILSPFISVFTWAISIAVVSHPLFRLIDRLIPRRDISSGITTVLIGILIVGPFAFMLQYLIQEVSNNASYLQQLLNGDQWTNFLNSNPLLRATGKYIDRIINRESLSSEFSKYISSATSVIFTASIWTLVQLLLVLFTVFYFFKDRVVILRECKSLLPLSTSETSKLFTRIRDTLYATLYGNVVVAAVQGILGGIMFALLGIPAAVLWGFIMALLSLIPNLGAFVIWIPAALFFFAGGEIGKGLILTGWGGVVVGLIDNLLYPFLVGKELRLHSLPIFFFILGGVALFGASGIVLGPLALAISDGLIQIWRRRFKAN